MTTAQEFWDAQSEWSQATFGSDSERGPVGPLKHLEKEAREAYREPDDSKRTVEIADCLFLVFDAARRHGLTLDSLLDTCFIKLELNKSRTWQKPSSDEPVEHVRGSVKDAFKELHAAGGHGWDDIDDPAAFLAGEQPPNPCPVSYPHMPHDYCDGKPGA